MANNSRNDDFPTIRLDEEDRRSYKAKSSATHRSVSTAPLASNTNSQAKSSGSTGFAAFALIFGLIGCGAAGYLYWLTLQQHDQLASAENRIQQLENKLSATGEEIGESTVALQVKVTELSNKTVELWEQMDKLWASAWRRNQKEISDLTAKVANDKRAVQESVSQVARNIETQKTQLATINASLETVTDEMLAVNVQMEQLQSGDAQNQQQLKNVGDQLSVLEQRNNALSSRIAKLEGEIRDLATQVVSSGTTQSSNTVTPPSS